MESEKRLIVASELAERVYGIGIHFVGLRNGKTLVQEAMEKYCDAVLLTSLKSDIAHNLCLGIRQHRRI